MEKKFTTSQNNTFTIDYSCAIPAGFGHHRIEVTIVDEQGNVKTFREVTNFMPGIDRANQLEGQEKYEALYDIVSASIDAQIDEWMKTR